MSSFLIFICPILILIYAVNSWMHNDQAHRKTGRRPDFPSEAFC
jgi:uncharacterized membrane protein YidH (DUF202 family)